MTLLEKKCFVAATGLHGLLALILFVGPAFSSKPKAEPPITVLTMVNTPTDGPSSGGSPGGSPAPPAPEKPKPTTAEPPPAAMEPPSPVVEPPKPKPPEPVVKPVEPEREIPAPTPVPKHIPTKAKVPEKPKEHTPPRIKKPSTIKVDEFNPESAAKAQKAAEKAAADAAAKAEAKRLKRIRDAFSNATGDLTQSIGEKTAKAGPMVQLGPGGGGQVFAGYRDIVFNAYYNAWETDSLHLSDQNATTDVKVVIARDGSIISAVITSRSGESALDKSVERALRRVTRLAPFPAEATDSQRTFLIKFDPIAKLSN